MAKTTENNLRKRSTRKLHIKTQSTITLKIQVQRKVKTICLSLWFSRLSRNISWLNLPWYTHVLQKFTYFSHVEDYMKNFTRKHIKLPLRNLIKLLRNHTWSSPWHHSGQYRLMKILYKIFWDSMLRILCGITWVRICKYYSFPLTYYFFNK